MKYLIEFLFCCMLLAGVGCAITDYGVIVDNDQIKNGDPAEAIVNTNGKAKLIPSVQFVTQYADGTDETFTMVDQKSDGTAVLTTYNNYSTGDDPIFYDDLYCNPDWVGCSIITAPDNNDDRLFDLTYNSNCSGARSVSILLATDRYYGECGRSRVSMDDRLSLLNQGILLDSATLGYNLNRSNLKLTLEKESQAFNVPIFGQIRSTISMKGGRTGTVDLTHTMVSHSVDAVQSIVNQHGAGEYLATVEYMGVTLDLQIAFTSADDLSDFRQISF